MHHTQEVTLTATTYPEKKKTEDYKVPKKH